MRREGWSVSALSFVLTVLGVAGIAGSGSPAIHASGRREQALPAPVPCARCFHPPPQVTWQWQLTGALDTHVKAKIYDIDLFSSSRANVSSLHHLGRRVVCYIDAGSWENWRPDSARFPKSLIGRALQGWPGERWLNVRRLSILGSIMRARVEICKRKGFDGVEFDNVDGWQNLTGFHITAREQLRYNIFLANLAHSLGLSVALKNDPDQVRKLLPYFDWSLNEQCFQYAECYKLLPFVRARKPVLEVEYSFPLSKFCARSRSLGFNSLRKHLRLGPWLQRCGPIVIGRRVPVDGLR